MIGVTEDLGMDDFGAAKTLTYQCSHIFEPFQQLGGDGVQPAAGWQRGHQ